MKKTRRKIVDNLGRTWGELPEAPAPKPKRRRLAKLTRSERKAWDFAYGTYADPQSSKRDKQAAEMAWADLQADFPRLRKYDGCKP